MVSSDPAPLNYSVSVNQRTEDLCTTRTCEYEHTMVTIVFQTAHCLG
jgi:hypothetical protein